MYQDSNYMTFIMSVCMLYRMGKYGIGELWNQTKNIHYFSYNIMIHAKSYYYRCEMELLDSMVYDILRK